MHIQLHIVHVQCAIVYAYINVKTLTFKVRFALTREIATFLDTFTSGCIASWAPLNHFITHFALIPVLAFTLEIVDEIFTRSFILTRVVFTIVDVDGAIASFKSSLERRADLINKNQ